MEKSEFIGMMQQHQEVIQYFEDKSHARHCYVNLPLDDISRHTCPIRFIVQALKEFGAGICQSPEDVLPLFYAVCFHDALRFLRMDYKDTLELAEANMSEEQAKLAADLIFVLTPNKGRTRREMYGKAAMDAVRATPYAPFVKLCIRLGQIRYLVDRQYEPELHGLDDEFPFLLRALDFPTDDKRLTLPEELINEIYKSLAGHSRF